MIKTYTKFLINGFIKSFLNVFFVMMCLVLILNILKEIEFFSNKEVNSLYPVYLSIMNSPSIIFEMFPFIFLITTQFFFLKLFNNDEINIFKYSGLCSCQQNRYDFCKSHAQSRFSRFQVGSRAST